MNIQPNENEADRGLYGRRIHINDHTTDSAGNRWSNDDQDTRDKSFLKHPLLSQDTH